jgi:hypothetical protein
MRAASSAAAGEAPKKYRPDSDATRTRIRGRSRGPGFTCPCPGWQWQAAPPLPARAGHVPAAPGAKPGQVVHAWSTRTLAQNFRLAPSSHMIFLGRRARRAALRSYRGRSLSSDPRNDSSGSATDPILIILLFPCTTPSLIGGASSGLGCIRIRGPPRARRACLLGDGFAVAPSRVVFFGWIG